MSGLIYHFDFQIVHDADLADHRTKWRQKQKKQPQKYRGMSHENCVIAHINACINDMKVKSKDKFRSNGK